MLDLSKVNVIQSLIKAGLFVNEKTTAERMVEVKKLTDADKQYLIDRMEVECPDLIQHKS